jgi:hypothetical protein
MSSARDAAASCPSRERLGDRPSQCRSPVAARLGCSPSACMSGGAAMPAGGQRQAGEHRACSTQRERRFRCARSRARTEDVVRLRTCIPVFRVATPSVLPYSVFRPGGWREPRGFTAGCSAAGRSSTLGARACACLRRVRGPWIGGGQARGPQWTVRAAAGRVAACRRGVAARRAWGAQQARTGWKRP